MFPSVRALNKPSRSPEWFGGPWTPQALTSSFFGIFEFFHGINKKKLENGLAVDFEDAYFDVENIGSLMSLRYPNWVGPRVSFAKKISYNLFIKKIKN